MAARESNKGLLFRPFENLPKELFPEVPRGAEHAHTHDGTPGSSSSQAASASGLVEGAAAFGELPESAQVHPPAEEEDDLLLRETFLPGFQDRYRLELRKTLEEIDELQSENRWDDILALFYPPEEKAPVALEADAEGALRRRIAFALGQSGRFEEALGLLLPAVEACPDDFLLHAAIGFNAYQSLLRRQGRKVTLIPEKRAERTRLAHHHFRRCQEIRPDSVTSFYREGMLYKEVEGKTFKAESCFKQAVANWESLTPEDRRRRHQERPKYLRSLYHLAACVLANGEPRRASEIMRKCLEEDLQKNLLSPVHKHFAMAKILHALDQQGEALEHLQTAVRAARPEEPTDYIWELAARCSLAQHKIDQGLQYIEKIPEKKRRPYVRWTEADLHLAKGDAAKAEQVLRKSAETDRRSRHKTLMRLASLLYRNGDPERSLEAAEDALQFFRSVYGNEYQEALFWIAGCLLRLDRRDEAATFLEELERQNPRFPHLRELRERIRRRVK